MPDRDENEFETVENLKKQVLTLKKDEREFCINDDLNFLFRNSLNTSPNP